MLDRKETENRAVSRECEKRDRLEKEKGKSRIIPVMFRQTEYPAHQT